MITLLWKRCDGSFVAKINGYPYHVVEGDEPLWSQARKRAAEMGGELGFEPPLPPRPDAVLHRLPKADFWRRVTETEAEAIVFALASAPLRLRMIFEAAPHLDTREADYPALRKKIVAAIGEERAQLVLAPTE